MQFFPPVKATSQQRTTETKAATSGDMKRQQGFSALLSTELATEGRNFSLSKNIRSGKTLGMSENGSSVSSDTERAERQSAHADSKHDPTRIRSKSAHRVVAFDAENIGTPTDMPLLTECGVHVSSRMPDVSAGSEDGTKSGASGPEAQSPGQNEPDAMRTKPGQKGDVILCSLSTLRQGKERESSPRNERTLPIVQPVGVGFDDTASAEKKEPPRILGAGLEQWKRELRVFVQQEVRPDSVQRPAEMGGGSVLGAEYSHLTRQRENGGQIAEFSKGSDRFDFRAETQSGVMTTLHTARPAAEAGRQRGSDLFKVPGASVAVPEEPVAGRKTGGTSVLNKPEAQPGVQHSAGEGSVSAGSAIMSGAQAAGRQDSGESLLNKSGAKSGVQTAPGQGSVSAGPAIALGAQQSRMQAGEKSREHSVDMRTELRSVPVESGVRASSPAVVERPESGGEPSGNSGPDKPDMRSESPIMPGPTEHRFMSTTKKASDDRTVFGRRIRSVADFAGSRQPVAIFEKGAWVASPMGLSDDSSSGLDQPPASAPAHSLDRHSPQTEKTTSAEAVGLMKDQQKGIHVPLQQQRMEAKGEVERKDAPRYGNAPKEEVQLSEGQGAQSDVRRESTVGGRQNRSSRVVEEEIFAAPMQDAAPRVRGTDGAGSSLFGDENFGPLFQDRGGSPLQQHVQTGRRDRSAEVYRQVENGIFTNLGQGGKQLVIRLDPPDLGQIRVILQVRGNEVQAVLRTPDENTSHALHEQLSQLRTQLESQGLKVTRLEVQTDAADSDTQSQWQGAGEHNRFQENRESAMTAGRLRVLGRASAGVVQDVQSPLHKEKSSPTGVDIFA